MILTDLAVEFAMSTLMLSDWLVKGVYLVDNINLQRLRTGLLAVLHIISLFLYMKMLIIIFVVDFMLVRLPCMSHCMVI